MNEMGFEPQFYSLLLDSNLHYKSNNYEDNLESTYSKVFKSK
jgi:hypothetical protein